MISAAFTTDDGHNHYSGMANCIFRMAAVISLASTMAIDTNSPRWTRAKYFPSLASRGGIPTGRTIIRES